MFVLAHLSDPHLSPLPRPRWSDLMGKRATGYVNWVRKRRLIHRTDVLARVVRDLKASMPDHIAVTGDLTNISLAQEYAPARVFLELLGPAPDVTLVPGNHDVYVRGVRGYSRSHWGAYMRGDEGEELPTHSFPSCGGAACLRSSACRVRFRRLLSWRPAGLGAPRLTGLPRSSSSVAAKGGFAWSSFTTRPGRAHVDVSSGSSMPRNCGRHCNGTGPSSSCTDMITCIR